MYNSNGGSRASQPGPNANNGKVFIQGREYETVASRVQRFHASWQGYRIITEILERTETVVVMKAMIQNPEGVTLATGHAEEFRSSSHINKTSALENCETSCIGRALAAFGLGGTEFASADELANALSKQAAPKPTKSAFVAPSQAPSSDQPKPASIVTERDKKPQPKVAEPINSGRINPIGDNEEPKPGDIQDLEASCRRLGIGFGQFLEAVIPVAVKANALTKKQADLCVTNLARGKQVCAILRVFWPDLCKDVAMKIVASNKARSENVEDTLSGE